MKTMTIGFFLQKQQSLRKGPSQKINNIQEKESDHNL